VAAVSAPASSSSARATVTGSANIERAASRARYQIVVNICRACGVARQNAGGVDVALSEAEVARAMCDAERMDARGHMKQDIPPATRKRVRRRDGDRCTVPGCRSAQFLELHHVTPASEGGGHEPENLTTLCGAHHDARHDGRLIIRGRAPDLVFEWTVPRSHMEEIDEDVVEDVAEVDGDVFHVEEPRVPVAMRADAELALITLGYKRGVSRAAVERACTRVGATCDLEGLIRAALQSIGPG
jgi:5-methylcytosine-specific restriction endonuclease McrA